MLDIISRSTANKQKDQSAKLIIDHLELMSTRYLAKFALKRNKGTSRTEDMLPHFYRLDDQLTDGLSHEPGAT
jgi:hypothetical protein